jgi:orotate phosphoribosyltransferase
VSSDALDAAGFAAYDLLTAGCVSINTQQPFKLASGRLSPVYVDVRRLISYPQQRNSIILQLAGTMQTTAEFDIVAGGETAGIPFAAWVAARRRLPMIYVRKQPKEYGQRSQIEGVLKPGAQVALIEDLVSEGTSKVNFINAIRAAAGNVEHCFVVFNYGIHAEAEEVFARLGVNLHALVTWQDVLRIATERGALSDDKIATIAAYVENPDHWQP